MGRQRQAGSDTVPRRLEGKEFAAWMRQAGCPRYPVRRLPHRACVHPRQPNCVRSVNKRRDGPVLGANFFKKKLYILPPKTD